jgi:hypothetical protein
MDEHWRPWVFVRLLSQGQIARQTRRDRRRFADRHGHHHRGLRPARASATASATRSSCSGPTASRRRTSSRTSAASPLPRARTAPGAPCGTLRGRRATGTPRTDSRSAPHRNDAAADPRGHAATCAHSRAPRRVCHRPGTGESHDANPQARGRAEPKHSKAAATSPRPHVSA